MIRIISILMMLSTAALGSEPDDAVAAPPNKPKAKQSEPARKMGWGLGRIARAAQEMSKMGDWQNQAPNIERSLNRLWEENEWNEESDQFALELVHGVAKIPPWEIARRIEHLTEGIGARYDMTKAQRGRLQGKFYQFMGTMAVEHGGIMFSHISEMVELYQARKPVTPEVVARWVREGEEMFEDADAQFRELATSVSADMNDQQRALFERDFASYEKRMVRLEDMRERWRLGGWHPREWGLEQYEIYERMMAERVRDGRYDEQVWQRLDEELQAQREQRNRKANLPYDESVWEKYVREFIARYALDDAQSEAALSILRELQLRAKDVRRVAQQHRAKDLPGPAVGESDAIQQLFDELRTRLGRIPSRAQWNAVHEGSNKPAQSPSTTPNQTPSTQPGNP